MRCWAYVDAGIREEDRIIFVQVAIVLLNVFHNVTEIDVIKKTMLNNNHHNIHVHLYGGTGVHTQRRPTIYSFPATNYQL